MSKRRQEEILPQPETVKTPLEELEMLAGLCDTPYFQVLKRVARRYVENMKNQSFTLREEDPNFGIKHTRYVEQAVGMNLLIKIIDGAKAKLAEMEKEDKIT